MPLWEDDNVLISSIRIYDPNLQGQTIIIEYDIPDHASPSIEETKTPEKSKEHLQSKTPEYDPYPLYSLGIAMHDLKTLGGKWIGVCEGLKEACYEVTPLKLLMAHRIFTPEMNFHYILDQGWDNLLGFVQREPLYLTIHGY
jgi:hypothetical protein